MSDGLRVTIAGLDFYGQGRSGLIIDPDGFGGWDDGVDMRLENAARPQSHGSFDLPGFQDARTVSISGNVLASSPRELAQIRNRFTGLLAGGERGRVVVERFGDVQWADGRLASKTMFTERGGQNTASFQIQLWCPDPRKYGEQRTFSGSSDGPDVVAYHRGNYTAAPKITIRGSMPNGYTVWVGGQPTVVTQPMATGPYIIDFNEGHLRNAYGDIVPGKIASFSPANISPGQGIPVTVKGTGGTATFDVDVFDTYI